LRPARTADPDVLQLSPDRRATAGGFARLRECGAGRREETATHAQSNRFIEISRSSRVGTDEVLKDGVRRQNLIADPAG